MSSNRKFTIAEREIEAVLSFLKPNKRTQQELFFQETYRTIRTLLFWSGDFETHEHVDRYLMSLIA